MDMAAPVHEQRLVFTTGRRQSEGVDAIGTRGLRPALLARYRDLARLRYDYPLVLIASGAAAGTVRSLSSMIDEVLSEVAPRGLEGERLRKHVLRLEREIRALCAIGARGLLSALWADAAERLAVPDDPSAVDVLAHISSKLQLDGELVDCDESTAARLASHLWQAAR